MIQPLSIRHNAGLLAWFLTGCASGCPAGTPAIPGSDLPWGKVLPEQQLAALCRDFGHTYRVSERNEFLQADVETGYCSAGSLQKLLTAGRISPRDRSTFEATKELFPQGGWSLDSFYTEPSDSQGGAHTVTSITQKQVLHDVYPWQVSTLMIDEYGSAGLLTCEQIRGGAECPDGHRRRFKKSTRVEMSGGEYSHHVAFGYTKPVSSTAHLEVTINLFKHPPTAGVVWGTEADVSIVYRDAQAPVERARESL